MEDYGESHYMGTIHGSQPNSQAWVDGFHHTAWLSLNKHFINEFKKSQPDEGAVRKETEDKIWMWGRPHRKGAVASADSVGRPTGWGLVRSSATLSTQADVNMHSLDGGRVLGCSPCEGSGTCCALVTARFKRATMGESKAGNDEVIMSSRGQRRHACEDGA